MQTDDNDDYDSRSRHRMQSIDDDNKGLQEDDTKGSTSNQAGYLSSLSDGRPGSAFKDGTGDHDRKLGGPRARDNNKSKNIQLDVRH